jgi:hypothetical protein
MTNGPVAVLVAPHGSLSPAEIAVAAGTLPVLFVLDEHDNGPDARALRHVADALAPTVYADFSDAGACATAVRRRGARTVTTFVDRLCPLAAEVRRRIGTLVVDHAHWGRKDDQRRALVAAGISRVRSTVLDDPAGVRDLARRWTLPLVVKPVDGAGSVDTWLLHDADDVEAFISAAAPGATGACRFFAEEYIHGVPRAAHLADYVSVEVIRHPAGTSQLAFVTDRAPLAWPCRETGLLWPTTLPPDTVHQLVATSNDALDVLGATGGAYHVEIKPGADRPEIIEVNGRLGGYVARGASYGADVDVARASFAAAAGLPDALPATITWRRCVAALLFPPPPRARTIARAPSRRTIAHLAGVLAVDTMRQAGERFAWRQGTAAAMATVWLAADDHDDLRARFLAAAENLAQVYRFVDDHGDTVHDTSWLASLHGHPVASR